MSCDSSVSLSDIENKNQIIFCKDNLISFKRGALSVEVARGELL